MDIFLYDGSFEGLITAVFDVYEYKSDDVAIEIDGHGSGALFGITHQVITEKAKYERVLRRLNEKLSKKAFGDLYKCFLSELKGIENSILRYIQYVLTSKVAVENNFSHPDVLMLQQTCRKVHREKHRMEAFVRFQLTKDEIYYAVIQPDYNVLPLIKKHFKDRYADQRWFIYDSVRKYGLYYDLQQVDEVQISFDSDNSKNLINMCTEEEPLYQQLWQQYFSSVNIAARKNMKLHIQHMPKRYWRLLTEKQVSYK